MSRPLRVAVLAGGRSSEHEISLASARSVLDALDPDREDGDPERPAHGVVVVGVGSGSGLSLIHI